MYEFSSLLFLFNIQRERSLEEQLMNVVKTDKLMETVKLVVAGVRKDYTDPVTSASFIGAARCV